MVRCTNGLNIVNHKYLLLATEDTEKLTTNYTNLHKFVVKNDVIGKEDRMKIKYFLALIGDKDMV